MLKAISLLTVKKIFDSTKTKLTGLSKMLYMNCLMHYFEDKPCNRGASTAFEIPEDECGFIKHKKSFQELHKAGLVTIQNSGITFNNLWGQFIDWSKIEQEEEANIIIEPTQSQYFRVDGKIYYGPVSEFLQANFRQFLEVWMMGHNSDFETADKTFNTMDLCYNCTDFENTNHIKNAYIKTWKDVKREQSNSTKGRFNSTFERNKAETASLAEKTREHLANRKHLFDQ